MTTSDGLHIELTEYTENGYWDCIVTLPNGTTLELCEVFAGHSGDDFERGTLRDMSGPSPREL